ncbi:MAG: hypothetical protein JW717_11045 [Marinilabiliaceae bacterium]|nr:hypothetical protein [Marinilabiliaceae bacterium]
MLSITFTPGEELSYTENIQFNTNDQENTFVNINITGTGINSGTSSFIELFIKDTYVDFTNMRISKDDPLDDVEVELYFNNALVCGKQITGDDGFVTFTGLTPGYFEVHLFKAANNSDNDIDCFRKHSFSIGAGCNTVELTLADSLFHYQVWLSDTLRHLKETNYESNPYLNYSGTMDNIMEYVSILSCDYHERYIERLSRLMLVEHMIRDLFGEGYLLGDEMFKDFGDLISYVNYSNNIVSSLIEMLTNAIQNSLEGSSGAQELFMDLMQLVVKEIIKVEIYERVTEAVSLVGAEVGYPADEILMRAWKDIWYKYSEGWVSEFGRNRWDNIVKDVAGILEVPFIQYVYIDYLTKPHLEKGLNYTNDNWYNGVFYDAFIAELNYVSGEKNSVGAVVDAAKTLRMSAQLFMLMADMLDLVDKIIPLDAPVVSYLDDVSFYLRASAYIEVVTALGISTGTFFAVPSNMGITVDNIYFPEGHPLKSKKLKTNNTNKIVAPKSKNELSRLKNSIEFNNNQYSDIMLHIKEKVLTGNKIGIASDILKLRDIEKRFNNNTFRSLSPVMAVADDATDEIDSFTDMYDSLKLYHAEAGQERYMMYIVLAMAIADSTNDSATRIAEMIDENIEANNKFAIQTTELLDVVTNNMEIPAVIFPVVNSSDVITLNINETGKVKIVVSNTGAVLAENVFLKISSNKAIELNGNDSIYIGSIAPGKESSEIELSFTCKDQNHDLGTWYIEIGSDNASVFPCHGSFTIGEQYTIKQSKKNIDNECFWVFPNPFTGKYLISYILKSEALISIYLVDITVNY